MPLAPTIPELTARARHDLRLGVPIVLVDETVWLVLAVETLSHDRWEALYALPKPADLAVTARRAANGPFIGCVRSWFGSATDFSHP